MKTMILATAFTAAMSGCSSHDVELYSDARPKLLPEQYFDGRIEGRGMFQNRSGEVSKRFHVVIDASWSDGVGVLDEQFTWSDGSTSQRVWTLTKQQDGRFSGVADDVVGAAIGEYAGNALRWRYVLALPVDGRVWRVDFDDWMFLVDERTLLNRSLMSKWGVRLGEVTLAFRKS